MDGRIIRVIAVLLLFASTLVLLGILFLSRCNHRDEERKISHEYFKELHLQLTGIVTEKATVTNDEGLLYVDIRSSSMSDYDIRAGNEYYYCVIHKGKAEIIEGALSVINIGDSIAINSDANSFKYYRNNVLVFARPLFLRQYAPFARGVRKLHRL